MAKGRARRRRRSEEIRIDRHVLHHLYASQLRGSGNVPRGIVRPLDETAHRDPLPAYAGMSADLAALLASFSNSELDVILEFMTRKITMTAEQIAWLRAVTARW